MITWTRVAILTRAGRTDEESANRTVAIIIDDIVACVRRSCVPCGAYRHNERDVQRSTGPTTGWWFTNVINYYNIVSDGGRTPSCALYTERRVPPSRGDDGRCGAPEKIITILHLFRPNHTQTQCHRLPTTIHKYNNTDRPLPAVCGVKMCFDVWHSLNFVLWYRVINWGVLPPARLRSVPEPWSMI